MAKMLASQWSRLAGRLIDGVLWAVVMGLLIAGLLLIAPINLGEIVDRLNPLPEPGWIVEGYLESTGDWGSPVEEIIYWLLIGWVILIFMVILEVLYSMIYLIVSAVLFVLLVTVLTAPVCVMIRSGCYFLMVRYLGGDLGHLATGLRVVDVISGDRPSRMQSLGRASLKALDVLIFPWVINGLMVLCRHDRRHLYDLAADTQVRRTAVRHAHRDD